MEDRESGIGRVEYALVDVDAVPHLPDAERALRAPVELPLYTHAGLPSMMMAYAGLEMQHGHTYNIRFTPTNYLELTGEPCHSSNVTIDLTPPVAGQVMILQHDSQAEAQMPKPSYFQYSLITLRVCVRNFTDPESDILGYSTTVYRAHDGWVMQAERWVAKREFVTISVDLEDRQSFYVEWKAYNQADLVTSVMSSVVTVDASAPLIDYVRDTFGQLFLGGVEADVVSGTELEIGTTFAVRDPDSGIGSVAWCLGTFPGACDVIPPVLVEYRLQEAYNSVRGLVDSVYYYATIKVLNQAGDWAAATTDGFVVDVSAPKCAVVMDGPSFDRRYLGPTTARANAVEGANGREVVGEVKVSWFGFSDWFSGIGGYAVAVVPSAMLDEANSSNTEFVNVGLAGSTSFVQQLDHAETYYSVVKVWDRLLNARYCFSDGQLYDDTPPNVTLATLVSHLSLTSSNVQKVVHMVHAEVEGIFDDESGVRQYYASVGVPGEPEAYAELRSIGTSQGEVVIGGMEMAEGEATITIKAVNNAKEYSAVLVKKSFRL